MFTVYELIQYFEYFEVQVVKSRMPILFTISSLFLSIFSSCSAVIVTVGDNGPVPEGNAARLTCDFERTLIGSTNHPTFRWEEMILGSPVVISVYQNGGGAVQSPYSDSGRYTVEDNSILTIINISRSDNDRMFQCDVSIVDDNPASATDDLTLSVAFLDTIMFEIISSPVIEGVSVMFICSVNANPDPVIILYKDEVEITRETTTNLTYKIDNVEDSDAGNYKCEASNIAGSRTSQIEPLVVYFLDTIMFEIISSPVIEGESVMFACSVNANPDPVIILYKDEVEITRETTTSLTHTIGNVMRSDAGNYTCEASNIAGNGTSQIETLVVYPSCTDEPCENGGICTVVETGYKCSCTDHFSGLQCSNCIYKDGCDFDEGDKYYSDGNGTCGCMCGVCRQFDYKTYRCESCSSCTAGLTIGMFFVGIFIGAVGLFAGLVGYMKIKQKTLVDKRSTDNRKQDKTPVDKRSTDKRKQDPYMEYRADTSNENQTYQDLQLKEETAYVNVKPGKNKK